MKLNRLTVSIATCLIVAAPLAHAEGIVAKQLAGPPSGLAELPGVHDLQVDGTRVRCQVDAGELNAVLGQLTAAGVRNLVTQPPTLEELFMRHYRTDAQAGDDPSRGHPEVAR